MPTLEASQISNKTMLVNQGTLLIHSVMVHVIHAIYGLTPLLYMSSSLLGISHVLYSLSHVSLLPELRICPKSQDFWPLNFLIVSIKCVRSFIQ